MDLSRYAAATLHQDSEFVWCRGRAPESPTPHRPSVRGVITKVRSLAARLALQGLKQEVIVEEPLPQVSNVALGRVIARETIETLPLVAMVMNPRIMQSGLKLEY